MAPNSKKSSDGLLSLDLQQGLAPSLVGAKSANLGRIMGHGICVPSGCVITRKALGLFLAQTNLLESVQELLDHCLSPQMQKTSKSIM